MPRCRTSTRSRHAGARARDGAPARPSPATSRSPSRGIPAARVARRRLPGPQPRSRMREPRGTTRADASRARVAHVAEHAVLGVRAVVGRRPRRRTPAACRAAHRPRCVHPAHCSRAMALRLQPASLMRARRTARQHRRSVADVEAAPERAAGCVADESSRAALRRTLPIGVVKEAGPHRRRPPRAPPTPTARCRRRAETARRPRRAPRSTAAAAAACPAIRRRTPTRSRRDTGNRLLRPARRTRRSRRRSSAQRAGRRRLLAAEGRRRHVGGKKRDAVERHRLRVLDEPRQLAEVRAVQRGARGDRHVRRQTAQARTPRSTVASAATPRTA